MNILIIGLGSIAKKHISALNKINKDFNIFALRSDANSDERAGVQNIYSLENLPVKFDFAIVSNPTHLHYFFIEKLMQLSLPLFIEKPAVHELYNVKQLVDAIAIKKLITYVACNLRFHPCLLFLKNLIGSEKKIINEVNVYCGSYLPDWRPGQDYKKIYSANKAMGGGVHLDLFHEIDYVTWLFGLPIASTSILKSKSSLHIDAIDYANYCLEYANFAVSIILNYYRSVPKRQIEVVFDSNILVIDLIKNEIRDQDNAIVFEAPDFNLLQTYQSQLEYFITCLESGQQAMNSFEQSIANLEICLQNEK